MDHLAQGDGVRRAGEQVTARLAAAAVDQAGAAQIAENLHQKVARDGFSLRQVLKACKHPGVVVLRKLSQRPARVFQFL